MQEYLVPTLVALSVGAAAWSAANLLADRFSGDRRKIKDRLNLRRDEQVTETQLSIRKDLERPGLEGKLLRFRPLRVLNENRLMAMPQVPFMTFVSVMFGGAFLILVMVWVMSSSLMVGFVAGTLAAFAPAMYLTRRRNSRQKLLADQLPDAMDFLGRVLRAGHSLSSGLHMLGQELPQPIAGEFANAYGQHSLGTPLDDCFRNMTTRVDSTDFAFFVTAVLIQRQTGGDLSEVLGNISGMIRQRIRLQQQVKAKTAEGRFTGYLLTAFPAVMFVMYYLIRPDLGAKMLNNTVGLSMLGAAFFMQIIGLFVIRKITTVKV